MALGVAESSAANAPCMGLMRNEQTPREILPGTASSQHGPVRVTASDVSYYMSAAKRRTLALRLRDILPPQLTLLAANEWNQHYRDLTHPKIAVDCFTGTGLWTCRSLEEHPTGQGQMHVVAVNGVNKMFRSFFAVLARYPF